MSASRISLEYASKIEVLFPSYTSAGKLTFSGALLKYFGEDPPSEDAISKGWADSTAHEYLVDYINTVLPAIRRVSSESAIEAFTKEIIERIQDEIRDIRKGADIQRLEHYYLLISKTYLAAVNGEGFPQKAYPEDYIEGKSKAIKKRGERLLLRKSFGIEDEIKLMRWVLSLDPEKSSGEEIGLMLMFLFGFRNGEACGLTFGDIHMLQNGMKAFYIKHTTIAGTKTIHIGGKTKNTFRVIPIYPFATGILEKRREYMEKNIIINNYAGEKDTSIDNIFIANGRNITDNLSAADLSAAGKKLFHKILGYDSESDKRIVALSEDFSSKLKEVGIDEKDPTTYLFRRNFATSLSNLGLEARQIQYLIGHDIEEEGYQRNYFSTADELDEICRIMSLHPFQFIAEHLDFNDYKKKHLVNRKISFIHPGGTVHFQFIAKETFDNIGIKLANESEQAEILGKSFTVPQTGEISKVVDILGMIYSVYIDYLAKDNMKRKILSDRDCYDE